MPRTLFASLPFKRFVWVTLPPAAACLFLGILAAGVTANIVGAGANRGPSAVMPPLDSARTRARQFLYDLSHIPDLCSSRTAATEYQLKQCQDFWNGLTTQGLVFAIPLLGLAIFYFFAIDAFLGLYRRAKGQVARGKAICVATVTNPPRAPLDTFAWFYCFQPIVVQLPDKRQARVYLPWGARVPLAGNQVAVYDAGKAFGAQRLVAELYAPEMAVVAGVL